MKEKEKTNMMKLNVIYLFKKKRFQLRFKILTSEKARISKGSLFHSRGAATENARWPQVFTLKFGSSRRK